ncbi:MAG: efflux RND transporter periplasmic adaptor subunit [Sandaracinaceae bacterium]|nr:efflux RND transporter periplasmic adaptor subunit [Sandaracinaceae bacterium]
MSASTEPSATPTDSARALRIMAVVRWCLLAAVALVAAFTWWHYSLDSRPRETGPAKFYCPMHPQIRSAVPGTCPICYMTLGPIPTERQAATNAPPEASAPTHVHSEPGDMPADLAPVMLTLARRQSVGVVTSIATQRAASQELRLPAVIEASENAVSEVRVRTQAFVERVANIETGSHVRAQQPLLWVYSPEIVRAEEELLTARHLRASESSSGTTTDGVHSLGDAVSAAARERLALLGVHASDIDRILRLGHAERLIPIRAPASGIVLERNVVLGTYATPEMTLFRVTDLRHVWVSATAAADELRTVTLGMRGTFTSRAARRDYDVEVALIEPEVSSATHTGIVRFVAANPDAELRPGELGEVRISLEASARVLVPRDAVVDVGNGQYVFVETSDAVFTPRVVEVGALIGEERTILRGVVAGQRVVSRGTFLLDSESRLRAALAPSQGGAP